MRRGMGGGAAKAGGLGKMWRGDLGEEDGKERNERILREEGVDDLLRLARSYSSITFKRSSSDLIEINASRSSDGS